MTNAKKRLVRITTVPLSLDKLLDGQLHFMAAHYDVTAVSSDRPYLEKVGVKEGVDTFHVEMTRKITPFKDLSAVWKLYRFLKKNKPFIVHTHTPKAGVVGMLAAKLARVPHRLHTVAGLPLLEATGTKRRLLDLVEQLTYACATRIYPNSYGLRDIILQLRYCPAAKLKVIGRGSSNGIDTAHFSPAHYSPDQNLALRQTLGFSGDDSVFVFVGRLVGDKGINELVSAFQTICGTFDHVKLLLIGMPEADLNPLLPQTLSAIENHPHICCTGYQHDVRPYLALSDFLAFPSYREGFPNVVMQAGAMGLPSVVSDINGCNEIIENGVNGLIIPVKDEVALRKAMEKLLADRHLFEALKQHSREIIVSRYEQKTVWEAILDEYRTFDAES